MNILSSILLRFSSLEDGFVLLKAELEGRSPKDSLVRIVGSEKKERHFAHLFLNQKLKTNEAQGSLRNMTLV